MKKFLLLFLTLTTAALAQVSIDWGDIDRPNSIRSIGALTPAANKLPYYTGSTASDAALTDFTAFARTLLDDTTQASAQTTLGLGTGDSPTHAGLTLSGNLAVNGGSITTASGQLTLNPTAEVVIPTSKELRFSSTAGPFGIAQSASSQLNVVGAGETKATFAGIGGAAENFQFRVDDPNSVGIPSFSWISDTDTGFTRTGADAVAIVAGGVSRLSVNTTGTTVAGTLSAPGSGTNSEQLGAGATVGSNSAALAVGQNASAASDSIAIGRASATVGGRDVALGAGANTSNVGANYGIAIGWAANSTGGIRIGAQGSAAPDGIVIGGFNVSAAAGQLVFQMGNRDSEMWFGAGGPSGGAASGYYARVNGVQPGSGATGGRLLLAGGKGGAAADAGGAVELQTAAAGSGTTLTTRLKVNATGQVDLSANVASTTKDTGALVIENGGLGVEGDVNAGGNVGVSGSINGNVNVRAGSTGSLYWNSRSVMTSPSDGVITLSNLAANDFARLQLGGTTASYPAIKRSGAGIQLRLADDSGPARLDTGDLNVNSTSLIKGVRTAVATLDFPSISGTGGAQDLTVTVSGAVIGDAVTVNQPVGFNGGVVLSAWVDSANAVVVRATNCTGSAIDPGSGSFRVTVINF